MIHIFVGIKGAMESVVMKSFENLLDSFEDVSHEEIVMLYLDSALRPSTIRRNTLESGLSVL